MIIKHNKITTFFISMRSEILIFVISQICLRIYLLVAQDVSSAFDISKALIYGMLYDLCTLGWILLLLSITVLVWSPQNKSLLFNIWRSLVFFVFTFAISFSAVSEIIFWDEFQSRFNFIAVDYLIYTHEVISNLKQSYAFYEIISCVAAGAFIMTIIFARSLKNYIPPQDKLANLIVLLLFNYFSYTFFNISTIQDNRDVEEISKNGLFSLFSAYINNDLSYERFYLTLDKTARFAILESKMRVKFTTKNSVTRNLNADPSVFSRIVKKYNIILITVESLSAEFLEAFGNNTNITPYLNALRKQSLFFKNIYATGTRTVYGLSAISLSMPPIPGNAIVRRPGNENMFSLGAVLKSHGYKNQFIYGGFGYFDNMNYFFSQNSHQTIDRANFADDEVIFSNAWGVCDEDLFKKALKEADRLYASNDPFFQLVMTTSNHRPFTFPAGKIDLPQYTREAAVKYSDYAIKEFIEAAKQRPWFDQTIFVIIADHTAQSAGKIALDPKKHHIPLFIYAPKIIKAQDIDSLASQIDLAPTLLGMLNLNYQTKFYGFDLMKYDPNRAFISNYRELGYIEGKELVIISPIKKIKFFTQKYDGSFAKSENGSQTLLRTAISYFQTASEWHLNKYENQ